MAPLDPETLQRARAIAPLASPSRIRRARELRGWTQTELARQSGDALSSAAISQLEAGKTRPSAASLAAIAEATGHPLPYFVQHRGDMEATAFFRSLRSAPKREQRRALAWTNLVHDLATTIENHIRLPAVDVPRIDSDHVSDARIEALAAEVRQAWDLGEGPIGNVVRSRVSPRGLVAAQPRPPPDHDAISTRVSDRPIVVLGQDKRVAARTRFDAAHELGHLVMHQDSVAGTRAAENQAHRFAAAFLMPATAIGPQLPSSADWSALLRLKVEWGVSLQALLMRARTLGILAEHRYVNAMKQMSARGWRQREPGDEQLGPPESPKLLELAVGRLADAGTSLEDLVDEAGLPLDDIYTLLDVTSDKRPSLDL